MQCKYYAVNQDDPLLTKFYYSEEDLLFYRSDYLIEVSDALYYKEFTVFKVENEEAVQIDKCDFVKELALPYTEIDVE